MLTMTNDKNVLVDATSVSDNWPLTVNVDPAELPPWQKHYLNIISDLQNINWALSVIFKSGHWSYPSQEDLLNILWIMMILFQSPPELNYFQHKNIPWTIMIFLWSIIRAIAKSDNNGCMLSTIMRMSILNLFLS